MTAILHTAVAHLQRLLGIGRFFGRSQARDLYYRAFVESADNGVVLADANDGRLIDINPALLTRLGYSYSDVATLRLEDLFTTAADAADTFAEQVAAAKTGSMLHWRERRADDSLADVEVRCNLVSIDERQLLALVTHDVSVRKKIEAQLIENQNRLDHLAHHDQLTGLPNRHYLAMFLPETLELARRENRSVAILFIDLDHFKHVNDSRGHEAGDKLLQVVAERIVSCTRPEDTVIRMGGDEFVVVIAGSADTDRVQQIARRINRELDKPIVVEGHKLVTTASIGVSLFPRDGADMGALLKHSDSAMYQAKETGRNQFQMYRQEMSDKIKKRVSLEAALRAAVKRNEFDVYYQPVVELRTNKISGLEALVRWMHPVHGPIAPQRFIEVAEESALIVPIGAFVLRHVMQDLKQWRDAGLPLVPVSVNISPAQLKQGDLANTIDKLLGVNGFKHELLELELTERAMFVANNRRDAEKTRDVIGDLRDAGVRIAIDDFGTGYSSLSYLKQWRVDKLKIDRSFIRDLVTDPQDMAIVSAILAIARQMRITTVAEGIESYQQVQKLCPLGCHLGQGYLFAKPKPAEKSLQFLRSARDANDRTTDTLDELFEDTGTFRSPAA